jgi:uncharacterized protein YndB with AHSA1/START domain
MKENLTAKSKITIQAPPDQVWKALTTPALVKKYMMGADVSSDWKPGGPLIYRGTFQGKPFEERGIIRKLEPAKLLQVTNFSASSGKEDEPENYALVTWELQERGGATVVAVSQDGIGSEQGLESSKKNWTAILQGLKQTVEA